VKELGMKNGRPEMLVPNKATHEVMTNEKLYHVCDEHRSTVTTGIGVSVVSDETYVGRELCEVCAVLTASWDMVSRMFGGLGC
jgi:hypothetical protein